MICVVLSVGLYPNNLSAKFVDTKSIFEYGYNNYVIRKLREQNAIATQVEISNGTKETKNLDLLIANDINPLISQDDINADFSPEIIVNDNLVATISQGQVLGKIVYNIDGIEYSSDLIASHNVERSDFLSLLIQLFLIIFILYILYKLVCEKNNSRKKKRKKSKYKRR